MGGLVLARYDDAANEWGNLGDWAPIPSGISCKSKINSSKLQGERTRDGAGQESGTAKGGTGEGGAEIVG